MGEPHVHVRRTETWARKCGTCSAVAGRLQGKRDGNMAGKMEQMGLREGLEYDSLTDKPAFLLFTPTWCR